MSEVVSQAVKAMNEKDTSSFDGTAKFDIEGEGAFVVDSEGAREGDGEADVTLKADADTFKQILDGDLDPTSAFMSGKLAIDGDMGKAMQLAQVLN
ncbi:SCP-2 sterol transfer family protein [Roseivivax halodurans JCM 10272]|uniref:SCP-2 sterol transfer family protein n=1 Tax=Roseivivax halodurans JCM 10272 TaxID=1449350 RepID=X7EIA6_9RHOB|nr:SCP2 sterol-binding domain-containing protein [Roseivivax halodurans]ETX15657.1 SCP-2 sterol transfer family protein [Roseivivax halodurans JCM 10272]